jgi:hypothetical protein
VRNAITDGIKANLDLELPLMLTETSEEDEELAEEVADEEAKVVDEEATEVVEAASVISTANPAMIKLE